MEKSIYSAEYAIFLQCLKDARKQAGITQEQLASRLGESQSLISKCERGERRIDVVELHHFCRALDITVDNFVLQMSAAFAKNKDASGDS